MDWARRRPSASLAVLFVLLLAGPVLLAIFVARSTAVGALRTQAQGLARAQLARSDAVTDEIDAAITQMHAEGARYGTCSPESLALMRRLDLAESYIQAVGAVVNDTLTCSSQGKDQMPIPLGPPDLVGKLNTRARLHATFPFAPNATFLVSERDGYAVVLNAVQLLIDSPQGVSVGNYSTVSTARFAERGRIDAAWLRDLPPAGHERTFVSDGQVVTVTRSARWFSGSVVAVPLAGVRDRTITAALILVPVAIVAGVSLAFVLSRVLTRRLAPASLVRAGLRRRELFVEYQPIVDLTTGSWVGAEALVRWRRNGELISPALFVSTVEDAGLGPTLTRYVLEEMLSDARRLFSEHPAFYLNVNLTPADLNDPATVTMMTDFLAATGARPGNVVAEATERALLDPENARGVVRSLSEAGIKVVIDDFGTGYSSLGYLETYAFAGLKIDKSFVDTVGRGDSATSQVVFHIIQMAHALSYRITAEGVESPEQVQVLRDLGVRYAQGWLFARAQPAEQLLEALRLQQEPASAGPP